MFTSMSNFKRLAEIFRWVYGLFFYCISAAFFKKKSRFVKLTPGLFPVQKIFDGKKRSTFAVQSRDDIDLAVLRQIFINEDYALDSRFHEDEISKQYAKIISAGKKPLIIDCGANSGLAARYFSETYSGSVILCVEPDPENMQMARLNNKDPGVEFLLAGIGSSDARADIVNRGEGNWAYRTETNASGKTRIISINSILSDIQYKECIPFLIKIDIEGFEANLFEKNLEWLDSFPLLIIELHDWMLPKQASSNNFLRAIAQKNRDFIYKNENIFSISNTI
jgi:FkbM family methyltransferase